MATLAFVTADSFFDGEENRAIARALDRDTRAGVAALFCALALGAAVSGAGHSGAAATAAGVTATQSQAQAVLGEAATVPAPPSGPAHTASGGS